MARKSTLDWSERGKGLVRFLASAAFFILLLTPCAWWLFPSSPGVADVFVFVAVALVAASLVLERVVKVLLPLHRPGLAGTSLKSTILAALSVQRTRLRSTLQSFRTWLMPDGFKDVKPSKLLRLPFRSEFKAFGTFYCFVLLIAIVMLVTQVGTGQSIGNQVIRTWAVFWVLMFAVSLTPCTALGWMCLKYLAATGTIQCSVKMSRSLSILANWVSIGGILGLLTGALSFVPLRFITSDVFKNQEPIPLSLLADLSLAGAVAGFVAAHFAVLFSATAQLRNRLVAVMLPVLTISTLACLCAWAGINPAANADYSLDLLRGSTVVPSDAAQMENLGTVDWKVLLVMGADSMRGVFPRGGAFALIVFLTALSVAMATLLLSFRSSSKTLACVVPASASESGETRDFAGSTTD